jgi:hypothetical protein
LARNLDLLVKVCESTDNAMWHDRADRLGTRLARHLDAQHPRKVPVLAGVASGPDAS